MTAAHDEHASAELHGQRSAFTYLPLATPGAEQAGTLSSWRGQGCSCPGFVVAITRRSKDGRVARVHAADARRPGLILHERQDRRLQAAEAGVRDGGHAQRARQPPHLQAQPTCATSSRGGN